MNKAWMQKASQPSFASSYRDNPAVRISSATTPGAHGKRHAPTQPETKKAADPGRFSFVIFTASLTRETFGNIAYARPTDAAYASFSIT